ncbi:AAA family ATPase, partial [Conexibacter stalactiti]
MLEIALLDGLRLRARGHELPLPANRPARALLVWLALHPGVHSRSRVAGTLRPERGEEAARQGLRQDLWTLRRSLGPAAEALIARREEVGLEGASVDAILLRGQAEGGDAQAAARLATSTLAPGLDDEWLVALRASAADELAQLCGRRADAAEAAGDRAGALPWCRTRAALEPLSESAQAQLIRLLAAGGDRAAALALAGELRARLSEQLGVTPSAATRALVDQVLADEAPHAAQAGPDGAQSAPHSASDEPHSAQAAPADDPPPIARPALPLPPPLALGRSGGAALVGRDGQLAALRHAWASASDGGAPRIVLLPGEAGIGKTRLTAELARTPHADGGLVLYGRCDEERIGAYQPLVEALDRALATGALTADLLPSARREQLARVLPSIVAAPVAGAAAAASSSGFVAAGSSSGGIVASSTGATATGGPSAFSADGETRRAPADGEDRLHLFEAFAAGLRAAASVSPALLVLDDLHWADRPTAALALHLARALEGTPLLIVLAYRDTALTDADHPLAPLRAELRRRDDALELPLGPLSAEALGALTPDAEIARTVHRRSGGNALFAIELLRDLAERDGDGAGHASDAVPLAVHDVILQRVARLGDDAGELLRAAAVAGQRFSLADVEALCDLDEGRLLTALETALAARLLRELDERSYASGPAYAFAHALVCDALAQGISAARRTRLQLALGHSLAQRGAPAGAVARRLLAAAP